RERETVALGELLQLRRLVARDADDGVSGALQRGERVAEVAGLRGAARRHRGRVEVEHNLLASEIAELHSFAVLVLQGEVGGCGTGLEARGGHDPRLAAGV